jgi:hypothetical protein
MPRLYSDFCFSVDAPSTKCQVPAYDFVSIDIDIQSLLSADTPIQEEFWTAGLYRRADP